MSKSGRGQKCNCNHARIKHEPNAGKCKECECNQFVAIKIRGIRLKDSTKEK